MKTELENSGIGDKQVERTQRRSSSKVIELRSKDQTKTRDKVYLAPSKKGGGFFRGFLTALLMLASFAVVGYALADKVPAIGDLLARLSAPAPSASENEEQGEQPQQIQELETAVQSLRQQIESAGAENNELLTKLDTINDDYRKLEQEYSSAQGLWQQDQQSLVEESDRLKAMLAEATSNCIPGMVYVKGGNFLFGTPDNDSDKNLGEIDARMIPMKGFCIDPFEFPNKPGAKPMANVTWLEAANACEQQGKRLCSEREWERACKGYKNSRYFYDKQWKKGVCNTEDGAGNDGKLAEIGKSKNCKNDLELFDMSGNVGEWTSVSSGFGGNNPIVKGGSFDRPPTWGRCSARLEQPPIEKSETIGFRCCKDTRL